MKDSKIKNKELNQLLSFISSKYTKEDIDWYLSLVPKTNVENTIEIKVSSNSYADEK